MADDGTDGPTDRALRDLLDAEQHRQRVDERRQRQGQRQLADESVSFTDVLRALAGHGTPVVLGSGAPVVIGEVGLDYLAARSDDGRVRLLPLSEVASATVAGAPAGAPASSGSLPLHLVERLRELAVRRTRVVLRAGSSPQAGRIRRVGADVVVLELDDGGDAFVSVAALTEVAVEPERGQSSASPPLSPDPTTSG